MRLTDVLDVIRPKWQHRDRLVRRAAVARLTDPQTLTIVATTDECPAIRRTAIEGLTDEAQLARIAVHDVDLSVCRAAVARLGDQRLLATVAARAPKDVRGVALEKLTDQALLGALAKESRRPDVRLGAVAKLRDPVALFVVARRDTYWLVRVAATERLREVDDLLEVALTDENPMVRAAAMSRLTDAERQAAFGADLAHLPARLEEELCALLASGELDGLHRTMVLERLALFGTARSFHPLLALLDHELTRWEHETLVRAISAIFLSGGLTDEMLTDLERSRDRLRRFQGPLEWDASAESAAGAPTAADGELHGRVMGRDAERWLEFEVPF
jgi:hypothetical protein